MDLSKFKVDAKPDWIFTAIKPIFEGRMLAFDQSIAGTGWMLVLCQGGEFLPRSAGMIPTKPMSTSHEDTLMRGDIIFETARTLMGDFLPTLVVHEYPPKGGGKMMRPESSLTAAMAIRCAAVDQRIPVRIISGQRAKKRLTGNGNAEKAEVGAVLVREFPIITQFDRNNDNTRDALAIAVVAAEETR